MQIQFKSLQLQSFKNHDSLEIAFGETTSISGPNGAGKSSIGESITWVLFGTDTFGAKVDPKPVHDPDAEIKVELLISVDGKDILLGRSQKKTAKCYINEVPKKTKEFDEFVAGLFSKNLFLSLFNPAYFSSQHWQDQREQLLSYVPEPLNKEVLAAMYEIDAKLLETELKKRSLEDIEKMHKDRKNKHDKGVERARERVATLKEQFESQKAVVASLDVAAMDAELGELQAERAAIDAVIHSAQSQKDQYTKLQYTLQGLEQEVKNQKQLMQSIRDEQPAENCSTCGQALPEEAMAKVQEHRRSRFNQAKEHGKGAADKYRELKEEFDQLEPQEVDFSRARELDERIAELNVLRRQVKQLGVLQQEIAEAEAAAETIRNERTESIRFIDAVKEFRAKRSALMVEKVQGLFGSININLYEQLKNGEERPTFEITMDGKGYGRLSTAEKIRAGLEVVEALNKQADLILPVFVDNAESILQFQKPLGQVIIAKVADGKFTVHAQVEKKEEEVVNG